MLKVEEIKQYKDWRNLPVGQRAKDKLFALTEAFINSHDFVSVQFMQTDYALYAYVIYKVQEENL